ncbi:T9SS type A sorting domain-containing protein [Hymenobacter terrenus]|uniref:T9SS type A sorting domain-containing protein n=1 Tax=Hymenobacter terrenus TaxID=1629124 RepID=UPI00061991E0|nr:T9SS type A sorting domain-containing protein [Hymenobacter terrenus]
MKHFLQQLLVILLLAIGAEAQSANPAIWCPPGATWTYNYGLFSEFGTVTVRYQRDTLVAGQPAQVLTRELKTSFWVVFPTVSAPGPTYKLSNVITRVVADRVEVQANGQFYKLYDFAALPGSSWLTAPVTPQGPCPSGLVRVNVDSVGRQVVAGRSLRWFRAHLTVAPGTTIAGYWPGRIYEQLGNVEQYMQPQSPICRGTDPGYMGPFLAFQATGVPTIGYNFTTGKLLASATARAAAAGFSAFPIPSAGLLTLQYPSGLKPSATLRLIDLTGRFLRHLPVPASGQLDLRGLPGGSYVLLLDQAGQASLAQRIVVE